jgi:hypothetical protein
MKNQTMIHRIGVLLVAAVVVIVLLALITNPHSHQVFTSVSWNG